jgi:anti-anti-sigma factor
LTLSGELDLSGTAELRRVIGAWEAKDDLVIDCSRLMFVDAAGLRCLVEARLWTLWKGKDCELRRPSGQLSWVLELTDSTRLFTVSR